MKKAFRAAAIAAILLFALTFIGNAKSKTHRLTCCFLRPSASVAMNRGKSRSRAATE